MDYGTLIGNSFTYVKEGVIDKMKTWLLLVIATLILVIPLMGYIMGVYRGTTPAPEVENWPKLIVDGIRFIIVSLVYAIPAIILWFLVVGLAFPSLKNTPAGMISGMVSPVLIGLLAIVVIIITLIQPMGLIRFARTAKFGEAFNFGEIIATIKKIGWLSYILALIIGIIVVLIPGLILEAVGAVLIIKLLMPGVVIAAVLFAFVLPILTIFYARYLTRVYESAGTAS
ncbi:MAG: DUF4013 domain-containing protein [Methanoregula sp.]